jgi:hypothetical protein
MQPIFLYRRIPWMPIFSPSTSANCVQTGITGEHAGIYTPSSLPLGFAGRFGRSQFGLLHFGQTRGLSS